ncbi:MAG: dihydroxyacetone kinase subunit DhaL [Planctomycetota bacterium]|nr:dihydroxyacetone kinase subunit DhaL [Planctomycetota bacterium]
MPDRIDYNILVRMLHAAVQQVRDNHQNLSRLDSFGGDGDHGTTMLRAMELLSKTIDSSPKQLPQLLHDIGWAIMGVDGGAAGPLFGTFFMSMSEAAAGKDSLDIPTLATVFDSALAGVQKRTKAQVGDKTMIDALVPAVRALRDAPDLATALQNAAAAAQSGADSTKNFKARFGRAKNAGDKSIGSPDPGATSVALIFRGFYQGFHSHG